MNFLRFSLISLAFWLIVGPVAVVLAHGEAENIMQLHNELAAAERAARTIALRVVQGVQQDQTVKQAFVQAGNHDILERAKVLLAEPTFENLRDSVEKFDQVVQQKDSNKDLILTQAGKLYQEIAASREFLARAGELAFRSQKKNEIVSLDQIKTVVSEQLAIKPLAKPQPKPVISQPQHEMLDRHVQQHSQPAEREFEEQQEPAMELGLLEKGMQAIMNNPGKVAAAIMGLLGLAGAGVAGGIAAKKYGVWPFNKPADAEQKPAAQ